MDPLFTAVRESELLTDPQFEDGAVSGRAHLPAAVADVAITVDPDDEDVEPGELVAALARILDVTEAQWTQLIDGIATEIEAAVDDEPVAEPTDLRDDLAITSIDVLPDATLLTFAAPRQFPDAWIRAQLDDDLEIDDLVVEDKDDEDEDDEDEDDEDDS